MWPKSAVHRNSNPGMLPPLTADFNVLASKVDHFLSQLLYCAKLPNGAKDNTFTLDFNGTPIDGCLLA
jgi:hypothetical protein